MRSRWALSLGALLLAGCSVGIAGRPQAQPYVPVDPDSVALEPISTDLDERVLALSPDGLTVIVESEEFGICAVPVDSSEVTESSSCAGTEDTAPRGISFVEFSPDSKRAALRQDLARLAKGGAWILDVTTGSAKPIALPDLPSAAADPGSFSGYLDLSWNQERNELIGLSLARGEDEPVQAVVRIDSTTAVPQVIGEPLSENLAPKGQLMTAADTAVFLHFTPSEPDNRVATVDLVTGDVIDLGSLSQRGDSAIPINYLMDVSPDGTKVLLQQVDRADIEISGILEVDLVTGDTTVWPDSAGMYFITATYSPDGRQVMVAGRPDREEPLSLLLYSTDGSRLANLGAVEDSVSQTSLLRWSGGNVLWLIQPADVGPGEPVGWRLTT